MIAHPTEITEMVAKLVAKVVDRNPIATLTLTNEELAVALTRYVLARCPNAHTDGVTTIRVIPTNGGGVRIEVRDAYPG